MEKGLLMANVKISNLTAAAAVAGANEFEINESGTSKKVTGSQILTYVQANTSPANIGAQSADATLTALAGLATGANKIPYSTGTDTFGQLDWNSSTTLSASTTTVPSQTVVKNYVDAISPVGKQTIWVPSAAMTPRTTNGAARFTTQLATNGTMVSALAFDTTTTEYAQFQIRMPKGWDEGTVTFAPVWTANSTSTNGVAWAFRAKALANAESIDAAWGTAVTVTDNNTATVYQLHLASESSAVTISSAAELDLVIFEIYRDVANASDTLAADALLYGINVYYTLSAATDA